MTNPIETLRNKFACDLEEILQCPVCYETLSKAVPLCLQGHHVCETCQIRMDNCPFCKSGFHGTRNYLAENLLTKFEEIKSSLINPKHNANNISMVCVETQTDSNSSDDTIIGSTPLIKTDQDNVKQYLLDLKVTPAVGKGKFPCKIDNCNEELPHGRMIPHIRYYHKHTLIEEKIADCGSYKIEWQYDNSMNKYERVISIPNMGLFFLHITVNKEGDLYGNVQIINSAVVAKQFSYSLSLNNCHTSIIYNGQVLSCRTTDQKIRNKSLIINHLSLKQLMEEKKYVNCTLILQRILDDLEFSVDKNK